MAANVRIGMLTPSSNTVLEPFTFEMLKHVPEVTLHFSRFKVTEIALSRESLDQFDDRGMLRAAELLADAKVNVIAWNGTSASWLGFERDERLCERISAETGVAACTSVLAFREIFERTGVRAIGLVTPYRDEVQAQIMANWSASGFACSSERHLGIEDNFAFADVDEDTIATMVRDVARDGCDAAAIVCTNMRGTAVAAAIEKEVGIPVYDSIATTVWKSLELAGVDPLRLASWGSLFRGPTGRP